MFKRILSKFLFAVTMIAGLAGNSPAAPIKVACLGNSITAGAGIENEAMKYPAQLQGILGDSYEVKNFGQNSQTVQMAGYDLIEGQKPGACAYRNKDSYRNALAYKPDVVVLKLGTNDSKHINWLEDSPVRFKKDLNDMLDEIVANSNPKIYLCYPLRVKQSSWTINERNIHTIIGILREVAEERNKSLDEGHKITLVNLHTIFEDELGSEWNTVYKDGVHPNEQGAGIIARHVADAIKNGKTGDLNRYEHVTMACIGGMRTFGMGTTDWKTKSYPAQLSEMLGLTYTVMNCASGNRTFLRAGTERDPENLKEGETAGPCSYLDNNQFTIATGCEADIITIHLGEMDAKPWNWQHKDEFGRDVTEMVSTIREKSGNPGMRIILCIPPRLLNNQNASGIDAKIYADEVIPMLRKLAGDLNVELLDMAELLKDNAAFYNGNYNLSDAGQYEVAKTIYKTITGKIPEKTHYNVGCIGGIRTFGIGIDGNERDVKRYSAVLGSMLGRKYSVTNFGVGNRTILKKGTERDPENLQEGQDAAPCAYIDNNTFKTALGAGLDIVTIDLGETDSRAWNWKYKDELEADLSHMVSRLRDTNEDMRIYLCIPPRSLNNGNDNGNDGSVYAEEVVPALRTAGKNLGLEIIDMADLLNDDASFYTGKFFLNAAGHNEVAKAIHFAITGEEGAMPKKVICIGNSITAGSQINNKEDFYPAQLQKILGDKYEVKNYGVSGRTAQAHLENAYTRTKQYEQALAENPDIVVIKLGTNDSNVKNWSEESPELFTRDMQGIIDAFSALESKPQIYLCLPVRASQNNLDINEMNLHKIIPLIRELGKKNNLPVINLHTAFENEVGYEWESLYADGVHPLAKGAGIIAGYVADAILNGEYGPEDVTHAPMASPYISVIAGLRSVSGVNEEDRYPAVLQNLFGEEARVINGGLANATYLRKGINSVEKNETIGYVDHYFFTKKVINPAPEYVVLDLGDADCNNFNWKHKADFEADMTYMVNIIKEVNPLVRIFACLPVRVKDDAVTNNGMDGALLRDEVIPAIKATAEKLKLNVIDLSDALTDDQYNGNKYLFTADGHKVVAKKIYDAIKGVQTGESEISIGKNADAQVKVLPNPVKSGSTVTVTDCGNARVRIYNAAGQLMLTATVTDDAPAFTVALPAGYYLWTVNGETASSAGKLIVR